VASLVMVAVRVNATPERAFAAFTRDIGAWWRPNALFAFTSHDAGRLAFEPGLGGRLTMGLSNGDAFEVGRITAWEPPSKLAFTWRQQSFAPEQNTEVCVRFEPVGAQTRVSVEHRGWDSIPRSHAARHGFPLPVFQLRHAEWWQSLLASLGSSLRSAPDGRG
jgi:uncharacterized protein YndB with AHSA1/START domain